MIRDSVTDANDITMVVSWGVSTRQYAIYIKTLLVCFTIDIIVSDHNIKLWNIIGPTLQYNHILFFGFL